MTRVKETTWEGNQGKPCFVLWVGKANTQENHIGSSYLDAYPAGGNPG